MIKIYSTGCPNCIILESLLRTHKIPFEKHTDIAEMQRLGFRTAPMLMDEQGLTYDYQHALYWIDRQSETEDRA